MEHNFANIITAFDFLSTIVLRDQSEWRANKNEHGERYIMLIQLFALKVINNERKILTRHEIIDRIAEQIVLVITRVCKESVNSSELTAATCFIYLFKFTYFCFVYVGTLKKGILLKKIRSHSQPLRLQQHITIFHKFT